MWSRIVVFLGLLTFAATQRFYSVDFVENVREIETSPGRIVSGWEARSGQFPYQAYLRATDQTWRILGCGASVIHDSWVLTAAHCAANHQFINVRAGLIQVNSAEYVADSYEWYNHPTFAANDPYVVQPNDVALIKLPYPIRRSLRLNVIKLQPSRDAYRSYSDVQLVASGWGRTWTNGPTPTILQWTYLRGVNDIDCSRLFGRIVNANTICARWFNVTTQSVCQGDSGGPLVHVDYRGEAVLVGVTSFVADSRSGGCHSGHPGGFIRPGPFHAWIRQITGINFDTYTSSFEDSMQEEYASVQRTKNIKLQ